jgi:hypothetical protein
MTKLIISDLPKSEELDRAATAAIFGGGYSSGFGFIQPYTKPRSLSVSPGLPPVFNTFNTHISHTTNNFIDYDYTVIQQNPTNFNVHNGAGNSGTIVNSFSSLSVNAASPAVI